MQETVALKTPPVLSGAKPGLGHLLEFGSNRAGLIMRGLAEHGQIFTVKLGPQNVAVLIGPEYHRTFFMETDKKLNMATPYKFLRAAFGEVLFIAGHDEYLRQRPFITQAFRREKMVHYIEVMGREVQKWLDSLGDEGEFEVVETMARMAQEVAGNALMGERFQREVGREFWDLYGDLEKGIDPVLPPNLPLPKFWRRDQARKKMITILEPILEERREHPEEYNDFLQDFVNSRYHDTGQPIEDEVLLNMMLGLMFAGHETTAGQAAWNIILLLQHPDYLALVREEIDRLAPRGTPIDGKVIHSLTHLNYAITEVERLRPSADMLLRDVDEEIEIGGYVIPAGWKVQVSSEIAHRLPEFFDEPDYYDPLRFSPERAEDKADRFALIGFGGGTHKCIGMNFANTEINVITTLLLQQFDLELETPKPSVKRGTGANRPTPTIIRYRRRKLVEE
ncbi:MAG: cytochrome P450 [Anaerolineae bacterium]|nr:cytochrome P450 [Anaerolineae bacterium]